MLNAYSQLIMDFFFNLRKLLSIKYSDILCYVTMHNVYIGGVSKTGPMYSFQYTSIKRIYSDCPRI